MKTRADRKIPREGATLVQGIRTPADSDTTSEPQGRNALPGAPVKASMSDGESRNQGGTVEYDLYPTPEFQGMGYFLYPPQ